jgi:type II secretory pathway pseudopilin PulG
VFEAKVVVIAGFLLAGGVTAYVSAAADDGKVTASDADARTILEAAENYLSEDGVGCPTVTSLKRDSHLQEKAAASDAWGGRFRVLCSGGEVSVSSPGPDGRVDSKDDVRAARSRS